MKILLVHELFMPDFVGGGEKLVYELAKGLREKGHAVHVLTTGDPSIKEYDQIRTTRNPIHRYLFNFSFFKITKMAKEFDLIQTFSYNAALPSYIAARLTKKPIVCTVMGVYGKHWKILRSLGFFWRLMEKIQLSPNFTATVFLSNYSKDIGRSVGMKLHNTSIIPSGVNLSHFTANVPKEDSVLFVGRFVKQKGLELLIETAALLPKVKFILVGDGSEKEKLQQMSTSNVLFMPFKKGKELSDLFAKAKVFCLSSHCEGFPVSIVEAMASGCTIASTLHYPYAGIYVAQRDPRKMAAAIKEIFENKTFQEKCRKENIQLAKQYTWDNFVEKTIVVYENILRKG